MTHAVIHSLFDLIGYRGNEPSFDIANLRSYYQVAPSVDVSEQTKIALRSPFPNINSAWLCTSLVADKTFGGWEQPLSEDERTLVSANVINLDHDQQYVGSQFAEYDLGYQHFANMLPIVIEMIFSCRIDGFAFVFWPSLALAVYPNQRGGLGLVATPQSIAADWADRVLSDRGQDSRVVIEIDKGRAL